MSKLKWKPGTMVYPLPPVMVSCGDMDNSNILTVAWTGIICTDPAMTYISIRKERFSYDIIKSNGEFVINLASINLARIVDFCGVKSGRDINKFEECNLTKEAATEVSCPMIKECPINIECQVEKITELGSHDLFIGKVLNKLIDSNIDLNNMHTMLNPISYFRPNYYALNPSPLGTYGNLSNSSKTFPSK